MDIHAPTVWQETLVRLQIILAILWNLANFKICQYYFMHYHMQKHLQSPNLIHSDKLVHQI